MAIMSSQDCRFVKIYKNDKCNFLSAANIDYISFFMQYHIGILPIGTILWTIQQTIEKYCKAILNNHNSIAYSEDILSKKPYSHNINNLWSEIKNITKQFSYENAYDDLIKEISAVTTDTRYLNYRAFFNQGLIETFTVLGCEFRYEILGRDEFNKKFFGIDTNNIMPRGFLNGYSYSVLFQKLMHLSIEHGISFSSLGIADTYQATAVELSKATAKFCQCGKHKDIEEDCPMCAKKIWQNQLRSSNDGIILKNYLGN